MTIKSLQPSLIKQLIVGSILSFFFMICLFSCKTDGTEDGGSSTEVTEETYGENSNTDAEAKAKAMQMLEALGGKEKWANMKAIYFKETVEQQGVDSSFIEEKWIDLTSFKMRTEQKLLTFHRAGLFSDKGGWIMNPETGRSRAISEMEMERMQHDHARNMYVLIHQIAKDDKGLSFKMRNAARFDVYRQDTLLLGGFNLDAQNLPEFYGYQIFNQGKKQNNTRITGWNKDEAIPYPLDGHLLTKTRYFTTREWKIYDVPFEEAFDVTYYIEEEVQ